MKRKQRKLTLLLKICIDRKKWDNGNQKLHGGCDVTQSTTQKGCAGMRKRVFSPLNKEMWMKVLRVLDADQ